MSGSMTASATSITTTAVSPSISLSGATTTESRSRNVLTDLGFEVLSEGIALYTPSIISASSTEAKTGTSDDPTLLILCSWAFAQPKHIAKYLVPYQTLYPHTSILLVQNVIRNAIWMPDTSQYPFFQPAAAAIQAHLSSSPSPRVLLHVFSNGGSHAAVQLSETCRETCGGLRLPIDAIILDSCPGTPRFTPTVNAMIRGAPSRNPVVRGTVAGLAWLMVGTTALLEILSVMEPAARKLYRKLNDPYDVFVFQGVPKSEKERRPVARTYVYSKDDDMILEEDVVAHAESVEKEMGRARLTGFDVQGLVKLEEFVGTAHVNHVKKEPERYWDIVKETWNRSQQV